MKYLKLIIAAGITLLAVSSWAFVVPTSVRITPNQVIVQYCNNVCNYVATCQAQATGWANTGAPVTEYNTALLAPGQCSYVYVYAYYPYFFVNGSGTAFCE